MSRASTPASRMVMPLAAPQPVAAKIEPASLEPAPLEPPGLLDRPIGDTLRATADRLAGPAKATMAWGKEAAGRALASYRGMARQPAVLAAVGAALVAWFLVRALGTLVQMAAVALAAYAAYAVLA